MSAIVQPPVQPQSSSRQSTDITLSAEVLAEARKYGIDISQECEAHLRVVLLRERESRWRAEHADFIAAYNRCVEAEGLPLTEWRGF